MVINPIFVNFIATETFVLNNELLKQFCIEEKNKATINYVSDNGGWHGEIEDDTNEEFVKLKQLITECINKVHIEMGYSSKSKQAITRMYINYNKPTDYNFLHNHFSATLSGVYYVQAPKKCGNIYFKNPNTGWNYQNMLDEGYKENYNQFSSGIWSVEPEVGKLVVFPGYLDHGVEKNESNQDRISIVFNSHIICDSY